MVGGTLTATAGAGGGAGRLDAEFSLATAKAFSHCTSEVISMPSRTNRSGQVTVKGSATMSVKDHFATSARIVNLKAASLMREDNSLTGLTSADGAMSNRSDMLPTRAAFLPLSWR